MYPLLHNKIFELKFLKMIIFEQIYNRIFLMNMLTLFHNKICTELYSCISIVCFMAN